MPIIVQSEKPHPFLETLGAYRSIDYHRAITQDIRPLEIAILNLMANKQATEEQLARCLGISAIQVNLTFVCTDSYFEKIRNGHQPKNTPLQHIRDFYQPWSRIRDQKFDGVIVTGMNSLDDAVGNEPLWHEVAHVLDWTTDHAFSSLFLCWGGKAALKHFHGINSIKQDKKIWGVFDHVKVKDTSGLLDFFPDKFPVPVSRWKTPDKKAIENCAALEVLATSSDAAGPNILAEVEPYDQGRAHYARRLYLLNHPEYDTEALLREYKRDKENNPTLGVPYNYFVHNDPKFRPFNTWRHTGLIYANWVRQIYQATPKDISSVPRPFERFNHG